MADEVPEPRHIAADQRWQGQHSGTSAASAPGSRRRTWILVLAGLFLGLAAVAVLWILRVSPVPPPAVLLTISINEHDDRNFPPLASAKKDVDRIGFRLHKEQPETKSKELLRRELANLAKRPANQPLILYLRAVAIPRDKRVYLIPGHGKADDETTWTDFADVLAAMERCSATHRCLILDLAHGIAEPRLGVASDRLAETLDAILTSEKPSFPVLTTCSSGQHSLTSEALQGSVFAYYFGQGLQGHADLNRDYRITVKELASFVESRVERWARENRGLRQRPRLYFQGEDFAVVSIGQEEIPPAETAEPEPYPVHLQKAWAVRDEIRDRAIARAPRLFRKLEANLLRQERLWVGGASLKQDIYWKKLEADADKLQTEIKATITDTKAPTLSLALALGDAKENQALKAEVQQILGRVKDSGPKKDPMANAKVEEELTKRFQDPKDPDFVPHANAVLEALSEIAEIRPDDVRVADKVLAALKPKRAYTEVFYLQRIVYFVDTILPSKDATNWKWQDDKIKAALQTLRSHQRILASLDREPRLLPWIAGLVLEGDALRLAGETKIFREHPTTWKEGLAELQSAMRKYAEAQQTFDALVRARRELDRAYVDLPAFARLVGDWPEFDPQTERNWHKSAGEVNKLQTFFADPPKLGAATDKSLVPAYQAPFFELDRLFKARHDAVKAGDDAETLQQLHCLLELPLLKAGDRAALRRKQRELAAKLHELTDKKDQEDNAVRRVVTLPHEKQTPGDYRGGWARARMTLELLTISGFQAKDKMLLPVEIPASADEWTRAERAVRQVQGKELVAQWRNTESPLKEDALGRVLSPWEEEFFTDAEREAARRLHRADRAVFFNWLKDRYQAEANHYQSEAARLEKRNDRNYAWDKAAAAFYADAVSEMRNFIAE